MPRVDRASRLVGRVKQPDPNHPVMGMLGDIFDAACEFGLTRAEVADITRAALDHCEPHGPVVDPVIDALADAIERKGGSRSQG
jgi:hypothetical protein